MTKIIKKTIIAQNKKARHDFHITDTLEAGIILVGTEVKSLRRGKASIKESYANAEEGKIWLINAHIPEFTEANRMNHLPTRPRELLLKKRERDRLISAIAKKGVTLVPLTLYFNDRGFAKIELGVALGKKKQDKRAAEKERDWKRDKARLLKGGSE